VLEYSSDGMLMDSWTVQGQDLSKPHGVQVAANDAQGRLLLGCCSTRPRTAASAA